MGEERTASSFLGTVATSSSPSRTHQIAHGQEVLQVLAVIVAISNGVGVAAVASALRKKRECVSRSGAVLGSVGILLGLWLCWLSRWEFDSSLLSIGIACIIPISALGLALSLRKRPNRVAGGN